MDGNILDEIGKTVHQLCIDKEFSSFFKNVDVQLCVYLYSCSEVMFNFDNCTTVMVLTAGIV